MIHSRAGAPSHTFSSLHGFRRLQILLFLGLLAASPGFLLAATVNVPAGADLQAAIDSAQPGDTLLLAAGATFTGPITLRYKAGTGTDADWITIRTATADASLPPGRRVAPADAAKLAKIVSPGSGIAALQTELQAHHYKLIGLEIAPQDAQADFSDLVLLGSGEADQDTLAKVANHLVVDRCYVHGYPTQGLKRGIQLNSAATDVVNSYISDVKQVGLDTQAIAGWNGPGPFTIANNYLEAAAENLLFGGADPKIPNLVPSDITIRGNYFFKPLSWYVNDPSYAGTHWQVKNLLEIKNAQRVTIDGNVLENCWRGAQDGYAVLFTVRNQDGTAPWSTVEDVQFTHNLVRHSASAIQTLGTDYDHPSQQEQRITVAGNVFEDIDYARWNGAGWFLQMSRGIVDFTVDHNTVFQRSNITEVDGSPSTRFVFTNNITPHNAYGVHGADHGSGNDTIDFFFPGATFRRNVIPGAPASLYPPDNFYPATLDDVGFVNRTGGDYHLAAGSPYKGQGTDGKDPGADVDAMAAATAHAIDGMPSSGSSRSPYGGTAWTAPGTIEAENFDNGGEGLAYHDVDAGNNGGVYRSTDVDVRANASASHGYVVFNAVAGEWLTYSISVAAAGTYDVGASVASRLAGGTFHIEIDGVDVTGPLTAPTTGAWSTYETVSQTGVSLAAGPHLLRLALDTNGVEGIVADFDAIVITASVSGGSPFNGTPAPVPGTVKAADFDNGGEGVAYHDTTPGNSSSSTYRTSDVDLYGTTVLSLAAGEWLNYTVNVAAPASTYALVAQVSATGAGGSFHVEVDGADVTGPLAVPVTGNWAIWGSAVKTGVTLSRGLHVLRVVVDGAFDGFYSLRLVNTAVAQTPFGGAVRTLPGTVKAVDFDEGGEMVAYHDNTAGCSGSCGYRTADVDRWDQIVYHTGTGEWLEYTVDVSAGTYTLSFRVASDSGGGTFHLEMDGVDVTGPLTFPNTGGWNAFQTVTKTGVSLSAGRRVMRLVVDSSAGAVDPGTFDTITVGP